MRWALFFFGEYLGMVAMSALAVTLFLGGWHLPGMDPADASVFAAIASFAVFFVKLCLLLFFFIWVRWTLPRFRFDQLMGLGWKVLIPLSLLNIVITGVLNVGASS
jgi:NADH-quinone oxidoreductase subunit H